MQHEDMRYWLHQAYKVALQSKDASTQNGAILLATTSYSTWPIGSGYNGLHPRLKDLPERHAKPTTPYIEHAERAAIYEAVSSAEADYVSDCSTLVACWAACFDCARAIIGCGVSTLVTHKQAYDRTPERWKENVDGALAMLAEAGVEVLWYDGVVGLEQPIRHSGQLWTP